MENLLRYQLDSSSFAIEFESTLYLITYVIVINILGLSLCSYAYQVTQSDLFHWLQVTSQSVLSQIWSGVSCMSASQHDMCRSMSWEDMQRKQTKVRAFFKNSFTKHPSRIPSFIIQPRPSFPIRALSHFFLLKFPPSFMTCFPLFMPNHISDQYIYFRSLSLSQIHVLVSFCFKSMALCIFVFLVTL